MIIREEKNIYLINGKGSLGVSSGIYIGVNAEKYFLKVEHITPNTVIGTTIKTNDFKVIDSVCIYLDKEDALVFWNFLNNIHEYDNKVFEFNFTNMTIHVDFKDYKKESVEVWKRFLKKGLYFMNFGDKLREQLGENK